jgi:PAS domain S-box-containing protein
MLKSIFSSIVKRLIIIGLSIFLVEAGILILFFSQSPSVAAKDALIDAGILTLLAVPLIFLLIYRPYLHERKMAAKQLKASEERYRSLVDSTDDSIYVLDQNYKYLFMNRKHLNRMNLSEDMYKEHTYGDFHSQEETKRFTKILDKVFLNGNSVYDEHKSVRDGKYFLHTVSPVKDENQNIIAATVVSKNINELKELSEHQAELLRQLQESLEDIRTLEGLLPICAWCKKIRDDKGYWGEVEQYFEKHSDFAFSHGICPDCLKELNPEFHADYEKENNDKKKK